MVITMKVACVLITHLPMKAELYRSPNLRGKPAIIITSANNGAKILDSSPQAEGVKNGMPLPEALYNCSNAEVMEADEVHYRTVFDQIIFKLLRRSPTVEYAGIGLAFVDLEGTGEIYGDDTGISNKLLQVVPEHFLPRVGLGEAKFPSYVAAIASSAGRATKIPNAGAASFIGRFPIDLLPLPLEDRVRLRECFGFHLIGQVATLPVGSMQAQFGVKGRVAWELANCIDKSSIVPCKYQEKIVERLTFPVPATSLFTIVNAAEILLGRLFFHPYLKGKNVRSISIQANFFNKPPWLRKLVFANPVNKKETAIFALRSALEGSDFPGPLEDLSVSVYEISGESGIQSSIFADVRKRNQLRESIRQLESRLRIQSPIYKIIDMEPWSRIPERRQVLATFVP